MPEIRLTPPDMETLSEIAQASEIPVETILAAAVRGTLNYYRHFGVLAFLTLETKECHGCRLPMLLQHLYASQPLPPNAIPFNAS